MYGSWPLELLLGLKCREMLGACIAGGAFMQGLVRRRSSLIHTARVLANRLPYAKFYWLFGLLQDTRQTHDSSEDNQPNENIIDRCKGPG